jgi:outer membrane protein TolC
VNPWPGNPKNRFNPPDTCQITAASRINLFSRTTVVPMISSKEDKSAKLEIRVHCMSPPRPTIKSAILLLLLSGCASTRFATLLSTPSTASSTVQSSDRLPKPDDSSIRLVVDQSSTLVQDVAEAELNHPNEVERLPAQPSAIAYLCSETLDLASALAAVDGQHPIVGVARWRAQQAYAQLDAARVLWLPTLQAGGSYHRFDGNLQASDGSILDVNRSSMQAGLGAGAVGAGQTIRPGLVAEFHLADAIYQPKIVQRRAWARGHATKAALNDQLLEAGLAHQQLLAAQQRLAILEDHASRVRDLAELTASFAKAGEGLQADADRLATERQLSDASLLVGEEQVVTASARLSQAISSPPGTLLTCAEPVATPIELIPTASAATDLVSTGLRNRPELKEAQCLVAEACEQLHREQTAPLVPSVLLGMSYGGFGGGLGDTIDDFNDRAEFNALAVWQVRNFGFGEAAARREQRAVIQQTRYRRVQVMDQVAREIVDSQGQVLARARRLVATQAAIVTAASSYDRNLARIREGQGLPIEALQSAQALDSARQAYLQTVLDYNESQLRLYRAIGWPVQM